MAGVASPIVDACLVKRHVYSVSEVETERWVIEHSPATVVRDIHAVVLVIVERARVDEYVAFHAHAFRFNSIQFDRTLTHYCYSVPF